MMDRTDEDRAETSGRSDSYRIASDETRERVLSNPKVQEGLRRMIERHRRYGGDVPTISAEEGRRQLTDMQSPDLKLEVGGRYAGTKKDRFPCFAQPCPVCGERSATLRMHGFCPACNWSPTEADA